MPPPPPSRELNLRVTLVRPIINSPTTGHRSTNKTHPISSIDVFKRPKPYARRVKFLLARLGGLNPLKLAGDFWPFRTISSPCSFGAAGGPRALFRPRASLGPSRMVRHGGGGRVLWTRGEVRQHNFIKFRDGKNSLVKS